MKERQLLWWVYEEDGHRTWALRKRKPEGFVAGPFATQLEAVAAAREPWIMRVLRFIRRR